jgi:hypothetical protein
MGGAIADNDVEEHKWITIIGATAVAVAFWQLDCRTRVLVCNLLLWMSPLLIRIAIAIVAAIAIALALFATPIAITIVAHLSI